MPAKTLEELEIARQKHLERAIRNEHPKGRTLTQEELRKLMQEHSKTNNIQSIPAVRKPCGGCNRRKQDKSSQAQ